MRAIFFTQSHPDHTGGTSLFRTPETRVIAQANYHDVTDYWRRFATAGADVRTSPGNHDNWLDVFADELGDTLAACLVGDAPGASGPLERES